MNKMLITGIGFAAVIGFILLMCKLAGAKLYIPYSKAWWENWRRKDR